MYTWLIDFSFFVSISIEQFFCTMKSCCLHNITSPLLSHCLLNVLDVIILLIRIYLITLGRGSLYSLALLLYCPADGGLNNPMGHLGSSYTREYTNLLTKHWVWEITNTVAWKSGWVVKTWGILDKNLPACKPEQFKVPVSDHCELKHCSTFLIR